MLQAQGADLEAFAAKLKLDHTAPCLAELVAREDGFLARADARIIGEVGRDLGGGRMTKEAEVDFDVGVDALAALGEPVRVGMALCRVHALTSAQATTALARLETAFTVSAVPVVLTPRIGEVL